MGKEEKQNNNNVDEFPGWLIKILPLLGPLAMLLIWYLISIFKLAPPLLVPSPNDALTRLYELLITGDLLPDIASSLWRWFVGFLIGCVVGIPVGMLIGRSRLVYQSSFFVLDFLRSLPVTALFPLFLLLFGIGDSSKIAMAFAATVFVVILNTAYGVMQARKTRIRAATVFGASKWQLFKWVIFFEALPQTMVGMRTSLSLALIVVIVSEMFIGTQNGLGQRVFDAYTKNLTEELYAILVIMGVLGYIFNRLFVMLEKKIVFWVGES